MSKHRAFRRYMFLFWLSFLCFQPAQSLAQVCHTIGRGILGDPIELVFRWPLDFDQPPELLERPVEPDVLNELFSDAAAGSTADECSGNGIVSALNCNVVAPIQDLNNATAASTDARQVQTGSERTASDQKAANQADKKDLSSDRDYQKYAYATVTMRPVVYPGRPMTALLAHEGTNLTLDRADAKPELVAQIRKDLSAASEQFRKSRVQIDDDGVDKIASGEAWKAPGFSKLETDLRTPKTDVSLQEQVSFPERCHDLLRTENAAARAAEVAQPLREKLAKLRDRQRILSRAKPEKIEEEIAELKKKREELLKAGQPTGSIDNQIKAAENWLAEVEAYDPWYGDRSIFHGDSGKTKLDRQIKALERQIQQQSQPAVMLSERANRLRKELSDEVHDAEVAAIKSNPHLLKAETFGRTKKARAQYREIRAIDKDREQAIEAYRAGLRDFDSKIANAPDEATREKLEEAKSRYESLYDQWTDHSQSMLASRYKDLNRDLAQNSGDGIGPSSIDEIYTMSQADGIDTNKYFNSFDPDQRYGRAAERALAERETLGGTSTGGDTGWGQVARDTAQGAMEDAARVQLTPQQIDEKMRAIAEGKTTVAEAFKDQIEFAERYRHYTTGAAKGAAKGLFDIGDLAYKGSSYQMETMENALEESLSELAGEPVKIDYFGDRQHRALDKLGEGANRAVDAVMKRSGLRHGVKTDDAGGISLEDVWADPTKIADFYLEPYIKYTNSDAGRFTTAATDIVFEAGGKAINDVNKGGETALRNTLSKTGQIVTEVGDVGVAGAVTVVKLADTAADVAKSLEKIGDGVTLAKLPERAPLSVPGSNLRTGTDTVQSINNPELEVVGIPESLRPTRPMRDPLEPVANPTDDFTANVPGDAPPSRPDLTNVPAELLPTKRQTRVQPDSPAGEKTAELDLEIPPPPSSADGSLNSSAPTVKEPVNRPATRFDRSRIMVDAADTADVPASLRPTRPMRDPLEPVANPTDDFASNVPGDAPPSRPDLSNVPAEMLQTQRQPRVQPDSPAGDRSADLDLEVPGTAAPGGSYVGLNERLGNEFQRSLDSAGESARAAAPNSQAADIPESLRPTQPRRDDPFDADGDGNFGLDDGLTPQPTRPNDVADVAPSRQDQRGNDGFDPDGTTREMVRPRRDDPFDADGDGNFGLDDGLTPQPTRPNDVADVAPSRQGQRGNDGFDPDGTTREMVRPRRDDPFDADGDGNFGLDDGLTPQPKRPNDVADVAPSAIQSPAETPKQPIAKTATEEVAAAPPPVKAQRPLPRVTPAPRSSYELPNDSAAFTPGVARAPAETPKQPIAKTATEEVAAAPPPVKAQRPLPRVTPAPRSSYELPNDSAAFTPGVTRAPAEVPKQPIAKTATEEVAAAPPPVKAQRPLPRVTPAPRSSYELPNDSAAFTPGVTRAPAEVPKQPIVKTAPDAAGGNLAPKPSDRLPTNPDRGAEQARLPQQFDEVLDAPNGTNRIPDSFQPRLDDPFGGDLAALDPDIVPVKTPDAAGRNLAPQPSDRLPTNPDRGVDQTGLTQQFDEVLDAPNGTNRIPDSNRPTDGLSNLPANVSPKPRKEVNLDPKHLADRLELEGQEAGRLFGGKEVVGDFAKTSPDSPFQQVDFSNPRDKLPNLNATQDGPGFSTSRPISYPADFRKSAQGTTVQIRRPDGSFKEYRLGDKVGEGTFSSLYKSLGPDGLPDGNLVRVTEVTNPYTKEILDGSEFDKDMIGLNIVDFVTDTDSYFRTLPGRSDPDILHLPDSDGRSSVSVAVSLEKNVSSAAKRFDYRNNLDAVGDRQPNALEMLTMHLAIRDLNSRGITWTDHKLDNFDIVPDPTSPTGYRMIILDPAGMIPNKGATVMNRAANAVEIQGHYDVPGRGMPQFRALKSNLFQRMDDAPYGGVEEMEMSEIAVTTMSSNRGRDKYFELSQMTDGELRNYIANDPELATELANLGLSAENIRIPRTTSQ